MFHFKGLLFPPDGHGIELVAEGVRRERGDGGRGGGNTLIEKVGLQEFRSRIGPKERKSQYGIPSDSVCPMVSGLSDV